MFWGDPHSRRSAVLSEEMPDQASEIARERLQHEAWLLEQREAVAARTATGFAQAECGELLDGEEAIERLRRDRAEQLKTQG